MKKTGLIFLFLAVFLARSYPELKVSGAFRDDMYFTYTTNQEVLFNNSLESRLILERRTDAWRFYADARVWLNQGVLTNFLGSTRFDVIRAFARYYTPAGDITLGKTYISLGNIGLFNPFEMDKSINTKDLQYDKQGVAALAWDYVLSDLSGGVIYVRPDPALSNSGAGGAVKLHLGGFDTGLVYNRKSWNHNLAGAYFKGDLGVGINAAYAFHFSDWGADTFHELSAGMDYSFFEGHLIWNLMAYYTDRGVSSSSEYVNTVTDDRFFQAHTYLYMNINVIASEFVSISLNQFYNLVDGSIALIPSAAVTIANGFTLTTLVTILTGKGNSEFSMDKNGLFNLVLRAEVKL